MGVSCQVKGIPKAAKGGDGIEHHCAQLVCHHQRYHAHKVRNLDLKRMHTTALSKVLRVRWQAYGQLVVNAALST
jgi:hypothetical protein